MSLGDRVKALGDLAVYFAHDAHARDVLEKALHDSTSELAIGAARALGSTGNGWAIPLLQRASQGTWSTTTYDVDNDTHETDDTDKVRTEIGNAIKAIRANPELDMTIPKAELEITTPRARLTFCLDCVNLGCDKSVDDKVDWTRSAARCDCQAHHRAQ